MMYKKIFSMAAVAAAAATPLFVGCSSSTETTPPPGTDGGTTDSGGGSGGSSGGSSGGTSDSGSDSNTPVQPVDPTGTPILQSDTANVYTVTTDDQVVFLDTAAGNVNAVPLAGGTATAIAPTQNNAQGFPYLTVLDSAVLNWVNVTATTGVGKFYYWTAAKGAQTLGTNTLVGSVGTDGNTVVWVDNVKADNTADIVWAKSDGSAKTVLVSGIDAGNYSGATCPPRVEVSGAYMVIAYCMKPVATDAGAPDGGDAAAPAETATIESYTGTDFATKKTLATGVSPVFAIDKSSTKVLAFGAAGGITAYPIDGSTIGTVIDTDAVAFALAPDGKTVFYTTSAKALKKADTTSPAPTTLVTANFTGINQLSPDGNWVLGYTTQNASTGASDFILASAATPGAATVLTTDTSGAIFGDAFTADSSHILYYAPTNADGTGTLWNAASAGGAPAQVSVTGWLDWTTSGSKAVYCDNYDSVSTHVDLKSFDTASAATTVLVTGIDNQPQVSHDKSKVVFSWHGKTGAKSGIYVIAAP